MIKIAIAEDLPIVLEGIRLLLSQIRDFNVVAEYRNGREMLDHIGETDADIVLTDIDMPVMDGITATKQLIARYPDKKVIALSMYSDSEYYYEMIASGARGFILKQSSVSELEKAVRDVNQGGSYFSSDLMQRIIVAMKTKGKTSADKSNILPDFSAKEKQILGLICMGLSNRQLSERLFVSIKTVEGYKAKLMEKTGVSNSAGLIIWALKNKVVDL